jgi:EmrB/QacA subfamily drug resistance transporter
MQSRIVRSANYKYWAFGAIAVGTLGSVVDHGSVIIALPSVAAHYRTDLPTVQWVVLGYALTISALLLPMGRLSDLVGRRRVYIIGTLVFVLGAALAGSSSNLTTLILARIFQGFGAAMTQGTGMAMIISVFPANERGKAIGMIMTVVGIGAIAGPVMGGLLVDALGWRSVFFINVPLGLVGIVACLVAVEETKAAPRAGASKSNFDWLGAALSSGALITLLLAITNGHKSGWGSPPILVALLSFFVLLSAFVWWEQRAANPILDLGLFKRRAFSFGVSAAFLTFLGSSAVLFLMPFYLQNVLGYSPRVAGVIVAPSALCMALLGPLSGWLSDRYGWRRFTVGGLALSVCGLFLLSRLTESSPVSLVIVALVLQYSGMGFFYSPNSSSVLGAVEFERYGVVSSLLNLVRNAANVTSLAVATAIVTATMGSMGFEPSLEAVRDGGGAGVSHAFTVGLRNAFLTMMGLLLLAMIVSALRGEKVKQLRPATPT